MTSLFEPVGLAEPTPFQLAVLSTPRECDLALFGGKGSGKTAVVPWLVVRDVEEYGPNFRGVYVRLSHPGTGEFTLAFADFVRRIYGNAVKINMQAKSFRFPNGGLFTIDQLCEPMDYQKFIGKSYCQIVIDELGEYPSMELPDKLRASLRPPVGVPGRVIMIGNPGGPNHANIFKRFVNGTTPWHPRIDPRTGRPFIWCPSTHRDNPHIDSVEYERQLRAACADDPALLRAWLDGSFMIDSGGFFATCIDEDRNLIEPWPHIPDAFDTFIAMDYGSSAPAACYIVARSPGTSAFGRWFPRDSLILIDELSTNIPGDFTRGMGYSAAVLAERIVEFCSTWHVKPRGVCDDACHANTGAAGGLSIAQEFARAGVTFYPARKGSRVAGWQVMKRLLQDAAKPDQPGLYISRQCEAWWATVPTLPRDPRHPEDCDSRAADHWADAARYACLRMKRVAVMGDMYPQSFSPPPLWRPQQWK